MRRGMPFYLANNVLPRQGENKKRFSKELVIRNGCNIFAISFSWNDFQHNFFRYKKLITRNGNMLKRLQMMKNGFSRSIGYVPYFELGATLGPVQLLVLIHGHCQGIFLWISIFIKFAKIFH